jgi:hypothetical protein
VFLGSGLLFLAMLFASSATARAWWPSAVPRATRGRRRRCSARRCLVSLAKTYGVRMAAVFMISLATIWLRTRLMRRWLIVITYVVAVALLLLGDLSMWIVLAFPAWGVHRQRAGAGPVRCDRPAPDGAGHWRRAMPAVRDLGGLGLAGRATTPAAR